MTKFKLTLVWLTEKCVNIEFGRRLQFGPHQCNSLSSIISTAAVKNSSPLPRPPGKFIADSHILCSFCPSHLHFLLSLFLLPDVWLSLHYSLITFLSVSVSSLNPSCSCLSHLTLWAGRNQKKFLKVIMTLGLSFLQGLLCST